MEAPTRAQAALDDFEPTAGPCSCSACGAGGLLLRHEGPRRDDWVVYDETGLRVRECPYCGERVSPLSVRPEEGGEPCG